jgi:hypothetical protein
MKALELWSAASLALWVAFAADANAQTTRHPQLDALVTEAVHIRKSGAHAALPRRHGKCRLASIACPIPCSPSLCRTFARTNPHLTAAP